MSEKRGPTDNVHELSLDSAIASSEWREGGCPAGSMAGFLVTTQFVANGAAITVTAYTQDGSEIGSLRGVLAENVFAGAIRIPEGVGDWMYFVAEMPAYVLESTSGWLRVLPPVELTSARWDRDTVRRGDVVRLEARTSGIPDGSKVKIEILEHDQDGGHDPLATFDVMVSTDRIEARWEFEYVDDTDDIATDEEAENGYSWPEMFFRASYGDCTAESGLMRFEDWIEIQFEPVDFVRGQEVLLKLPDGSEVRRTMGPTGLLRVEATAPGPYRLELDPQR